VLVDHGRITADGPARDVVREYLRQVEAALMAEDAARSVTGGGLAIVGVTLHDESGGEVEEAAPGRPLTVRLHFRASSPIDEPIFEVGLNDGRIGPFALASMLIDGQAPRSVSGEGYVDCTFADLPLLRPGRGPPGTVVARPRRPRLPPPARRLRLPTGGAARRVRSTSGRRPAGRTPAPRDRRRGGSRGGSARRRPVRRGRSTRAR